MQASRARRRRGGPERFFLGAALLVPLGVVLLALLQLPAIGLASPSSMTYGDAAVGISSKRPVASNPEPPPTLAPPAPTPKPTPTPVEPTPAAMPRATPQRGGNYVVQPGDELKHIAADHGVSMSKLIAANNIPDPDSLRIGQDLRIPSD